MSVRGEDMPLDVEPSNDFACRQRHELRVAAFDGVQHELAGLREWERFEKREKFPFARNSVDRAMKALDVFGRYRRDTRVRGVLARHGWIMAKIPTGAQLQSGPSKARRPREANAGRAGRSAGQSRRLAALGKTSGDKKAVP